MANRIFYEADCDISKLDGKTVAKAKEGKVLLFKVAE